MKFKIKNSELSSINGYEAPNFPKYTSQIINLANQNAQGTRPKVVGQLSDLFQEFQNSNNNKITIENWEKWYLEKYPDAINCAKDKILSQIENLKKAINLIDENMINNWVNDLVVGKTYNGLYVQKAILEKLSSIKGEPYRLANPDEESKGIDGFVGKTAYSVKPTTYKSKSMLSETINVKIIYYEKTKTGISFDLEE